MVWRIALLLAGAAGAAASPAAAQNALGDGRVLEHRQGITASENRAGAADRFMNEVRFRNAIVTGNAPSGLSFRGDVGYRAPGEFTGGMGSSPSGFGFGDDVGANDLYPFRRDSYYSGLSGYGLRATDALQYQFSLTTGASVPQGLVGTPSITRSGIGRTGGDVMGEQLRSEGVPLIESQLVQIDPQELERQEQLDFEAGGRLRGSLMSSLRSPSAYTTTQQLQAVLLESGETEEGDRLGMIASPLQGVRVTPLAERFTGQEQMERGSERLDRGAGRGEGRDGSGDDRLGGLAGAERLSQRVMTAHDQFINSLQDQRFDPTPPQREERAAEAAPGAGEHSFQAQLERLRQEMRQLRERPSLGGPEEEPTEEELEDMSLEQRAFYDVIRRAGGDVDSLMLPMDESFDPFVQYMESGERMLQEGRYFDAEDRFARALAARPGDTSAQVGRMHAQLGAGMLLSAATNLRALLMAHPELAGMRYGEALMPHEERQEQLVRELRANLEPAGDERARRLERESALLLAYLGHQRREPALVREGLEALGESDSPADGALRSLLEGVWLGETAEGAGEGG